MAKIAHRALWACGAAVLGTALAMPLAMAEKKTERTWRLSLESGAEYDTNLHRVEVPDGEVGGVDAGPLMRAGARYELHAKPDNRSRLRLDLRGASKIFTVPEGQSENLAVLFADIDYQRRLGTSRAVIALRGNHYDAIDIRPFGEGERPVVGRSFRTSEGWAQLTLPSQGVHRLSLMAGGRDFIYKPDSDFSWRGAQVGLRYSSTLWLGEPDADAEAASIDLRGVYRLGLRNFEGAAFRNICAPTAMPAPDCFVPTEEGRFDLHHSIVAEAIYTGKRIYSLLYAAQLADSNSYGQALLRQRLEVGFTSELAAKFFLTARAIVRVNTFLDPLLLARNVQSQSFVSIEDENRNSLSLHVARDLGRRWGAELRVAVYSNEFATEELLFRRQTAYLGLLYRFEEDSQPRL